MMAVMGEGFIDSAKNTSEAILDNLPLFIIVEYFQSSEERVEGNESGSRREKERSEKYAVNN